jgi:hypothetical protein
MLVGETFDIDVNGGEVLHEKHHETAWGEVLHYVEEHV